MRRGIQRLDHLVDDEALPGRTHLGVHFQLARGADIEQGI